MKNKWYILLFIVLIAISLFAFQYVAELLSDAPRSLSLGNTVSAQFTCLHFCGDC